MWLYKMKLLVGLMVFSTLCMQISFAQKLWTLEDCIAYAHANNLQIRSNTINKVNQEYNLKMVKQERLPTLGASVGNTLNFGNQQFAGLVIRNDYYNSSPSLNVNLTLFNNGKVKKEVCRLSFEVKASQFEIESVKNTLAIRITQQYLNSVLQKEIVKISKSAYQNALILLDKAQKTTNVGITSQTVLAEAKAAVAKEYQNLKSAEIDRDRAVFSLQQLLQLSDNVDFDVLLPGGIEDIHLLNLPIDTLLMQSYELHPNIRAAKMKLEATKQEVEVLKTTFWPTVSLSAGIGTFYFRSLTGGATLPFIHQFRNNRSQQVLFNVNIPIYNRGISRTKLQQSRVNLASIMNEIDIRKQDVKTNIQSAIFDINSSYEKYIATLALLESSRISNEFAEKSYDAGKISIYDLNIARNNYVNAQGGLIQAKYNYLFNLRLLDYYVGKNTIREIMN